MCWIDLCWCLVGGCIVCWIDLCWCLAGGCIVCWIDDTSAFVSVLRRDAAPQGLCQLFIETNLQFTADDFDFVSSNTKETLPMVAVACECLSLSCVCI